MRTIEGKSNRTKIIFLALLLCWTTVDAQNTIHYVRENGSGNGTSWDDASGDLQKIINASNAGDIIYVAKGIYYPTRPANDIANVVETRDNAFLLKEGVKIYGGFPNSGYPTMNERAPKIDTTILSGDIGTKGDSTDNCYHVVLDVGTYSSATVLDGFTVMGGYAISSYNSSIYVNGTSIYRSYGGGISLWGGASPKLNNLVISNNTADNGGGIYISNSSPEITYSSISNNKATFGGGIYLNGGSPEITMTLITNNTARTSGGGVCGGSNTSLLTNLTIVGNQAEYGGGIYSNGTLNVRNSILAKNKASSNPNNSGGTYSHSLVEGATVNGGIISYEDPQFVDTINGDYHLKACSPAINAGMNLSLYSRFTTDFDGADRIKGIAVDLGAYEYQDAPPAITPNENGVVHVKKSNCIDADNDGSSWGKAYPNLADVMLAANTNSNIKQIWVAKGTYTPRYITLSEGTPTTRDNAFVLVEGVKIYGGFPDTGTPDIDGRRPKIDTTILSGDIGIKGDFNDNCYHVVLGVGPLTSATVLDGFTITGGMGGLFFFGSTPSYITVNGVSVDKTSGGGISLWDGASPKLDSLIISDNAGVGIGGGFFNESGSPVITYSSFSSNLALLGGGFVNFGGSPVITHSSFSYNLAILGGGFLNVLGSPVITYSSFSNNVGVCGGGVCNGISSLPSNIGLEVDIESSASSVITYSSFSNNGGIYGGGFYNSDSSVIAYSSFSNNLGVYGGGFYNIAGSSSITMSLITDNTTVDSTGIGDVIDNVIGDNVNILGVVLTIDELMAFVGNLVGEVGDGDNGGGFYGYGGTSALTNVTVAGNHSGKSGGIYCAADTVEVKVYNSIVAKNTAADYPNYFGGAYSYSLVEDATYATVGLISNEDPQFLSAATGDYRLTECSPAVNTGQDSLLDSKFTTDFDGADRRKGAAIDLGAYEYQNVPEITPDENGIVYVKKNSCIYAGNNGSSWATAYPHLADVLFAASTNSSIKQIWVAEGTYTPRHIRVGSGETPTVRDNAFVLKEGVKIYGGFPASGTPDIDDRVPSTHTTILSGDIGEQGDSTDNSYHVVLGAGTLTSATVLDGFTVKGGYTHLSEDASYLTVDTIDGVLNIERRYGGGISLSENASPKLDSLVISNNTAYDGGGIYTNNSSPEITYSFISHNKAINNGGGFYNSNGTPSITMSLIINDTANMGGGIYNNGSSTLTNVTVAGNLAKTDGGGLYHNSSGTLNVRNSIVAKNTATHNPNDYGSPTYSYSLVEGATDEPGIVSTSDPMFVAPVSGDYSLLFSSPAIDKGNNEFISGFSTDLAGKVRIQGCNVDLGAYEYNLNPATNGIVYVKPSATGSGDGSSWSNAYGGLARPLAAAKYMSCIKQIWVAEGTYYPEYAADEVSTDGRDKAFVMVKGVKVYGGFAGNETDINKRATTVNEHGIVCMTLKSILSGDLGADDVSDDFDNYKTDNVRHVVISAGEMVLNTDTACLDGFTLTGGVSQAQNITVTVNGTTVEGRSGGGIAIVESSPVLIHNNIVENQAAYYGGGMFISGVSSPVVKDVIVITNRVTNKNSSGGGGLYISSTGTPLISRIAVSGNSSGLHGGGVYIESASPEFVNIVINGNKAEDSGGGIYINNSNSAPVFTNMLVSGNIVQSNGGGISNYGKSKFINVTIAGNYAASSSPLFGSAYNGGIYNNNTDAKFYNSIVWGNQPVYMINDVPSEIFNTLIEGESLNTVGTGNFNENTDPLFVSPDPVEANVPKLGGDYRLQSGSPVINGGANSYNTTAKDLAGNARIHDNIIDLGAYEISDINVIIAVPDTVQTTVATLIEIDVLANDDFSACAGLLFDTVPGSGAKHGFVDTVTTDSYTTILYTPNPGYFGIDSLDYKIACTNGGEMQARIYILILKPLSKEYRACPETSIEIGFDTIDDVSYEWFDANKDPLLIEGVSTITVTKDDFGKVQLYYAKPSWKEMEFPLYTVELHPADERKPDVSDIRLTLCPSPDRDDVYLTAYLDSLPYASTVEWATTGAYPHIYNNATGELHTADFPDRGTFAYTYTRFSECDTYSAKGKAYVHILHNKIPQRRDTVVIKLDQAAAINISAIFGLDLNGSLNYNISGVDPEGVVFNNTAENKLGATIFNGKKAFHSIVGNAYDVTYRSFAGKRFVFEYDYNNSNCIFSGTKKIEVVVIITN